MSFSSKTAVRSICSQNSIAVCAVLSDVCSLLTISTQSMTSGGKKKCMFNTCSGLVVTSAILELTIVELFVANIVRSEERRVGKEGGRGVWRKEEKQGEEDGREWTEHDE